MPAQDNDILYAERSGIPGKLTAKEVSLLSTAQSDNETGNIVKNTDYSITSTRRIISVTVFDPSTGELITVTPILAADRLSGNIKIIKDITNAEISIITE